MTREDLPRVPDGCTRIPQSEFRRSDWARYRFYRQIGFTSGREVFLIDDLLLSPTNFPGLSDRLSLFTE